MFGRRHPVPNFHAVDEGILYRGGQPTAEGIRKLYDSRIRTIVNLRHYHSDMDELKQAELDAVLNYRHIVFPTMLPEISHVAEFFRIMNDRNNRPVFVHCMHGSDRTGTMCALYRVFYNGWSVGRAIDEMREPKYGHHRMFKHLPEFVSECVKLFGSVPRK